MQIDIKYAASRYLCFAEIYLPGVKYLMRNKLENFEKDTLF